MNNTSNHKPNTKLSSNGRSIDKNYWSESTVDKLCKYYLSRALYQPNQGRVNEDDFYLKNIERIQFSRLYRPRAPPHEELTLITRNFEEFRVLGELLLFETKLVEHLKTTNSKL